MAESVYKIIELVGTSTESWEKAAAAAVARASSRCGICESPRWPSSTCRSRTEKCPPIGPRSRCPSSTKVASNPFQDAVEER